MYRVVWAVSDFYAAHRRVVIGIFAAPFLAGWAVALFVDQEVGAMITGVSVLILLPLPRSGGVLNDGGGAGPGGDVDLPSGPLIGGDWGGHGGGGHGGGGHG